MALFTPLQVVSELQSKMHTRPLSGAAVGREDSAPVSPPHRRLGSVTSEDRSASQMVSSSSPVYETSGSASISSYENTSSEDTTIIPPPFSYITPLKVSYESPKDLDSQLDSVLKMMEDLSSNDSGSDVGHKSDRSEYAVPFKTEQNGPMVAPKPKRELYEALLPTHGAYRVSPVVNVSG